MKFTTKNALSFGEYPNMHVEIFCYLRMSNYILYKQRLCR